MSTLPGPESEYPFRPFIRNPKGSSTHRCWCGETFKGRSAFRKHWNKEHW